MKLTWTAALQQALHSEYLEVQGISIQAESIWRPGFSRKLADEMLRQAVLGISDIEQFKKVAPNHSQALWTHPFEGRYLGLANINDLLQRVGDGRKAVIQWPVEYCWTALQILRREGNYHWMLFQRSLDLWLGYPYDAFFLKGLAARVGDVGSITWFVGSAHLYERDKDAATAFLAALQEVKA